MGPWGLCRGGPSRRAERPGHIRGTKPFPASSLETEKPSECWVSRYRPCGDTFKPRGEEAAGEDQLLQLPCSGVPTQLSSFSPDTSWRDQSGSPEGRCGGRSPDLREGCPFGGGGARPTGVELVGEECPSERSRLATPDFLPSSSRTVRAVEITCLFAPGAA